MEFNLIKLLLLSDKQFKSDILGIEILASWVIY